MRRRPPSVGDLLGASCGEFEDGEATFSEGQEAHLPLPFALEAALGQENQVFSTATGAILPVTISQNGVENVTGR